MAITYNCYRADESDMQTFRHQFSKQTPPMVCKDDDDNIYLIGGNYRFTSRGIIENDDSRYDHIID